MNYLEMLKNEEEMFFNFMKEKHPVHFKSNIFLRDLQYSIFLYFGKKEVKIDLFDAGIVAKDFAGYLVNEEKLKVLDDITWTVTFDNSPIKEETLEGAEA